MSRSFPHLRLPCLLRPLLRSEAALLRRRAGEILCERPCARSRTQGACAPTPQRRSCSGLSTRPLKAFEKRASVAPSTMRWSADQDTLRTCAATTRKEGAPAAAPSTGASAAAKRGTRATFPSAPMAICGAQRSGAARRCEVEGEGETASPAPGSDAAPRRERPGPEARVVACVRASSRRAPPCRLEASSVLGAAARARRSAQRSEANARWASG